MCGPIVGDTANYFLCSYVFFRALITSWWLLEGWKRSATKFLWKTAKSTRFDRSTKRTVGEPPQHHFSTFHIFPFEKPASSFKTPHLFDLSLKMNVKNIFAADTVREICMIPINNGTWLSLFSTSMHFSKCVKKRREM